MKIRRKALAIVGALGFLIATAAHALPQYREIITYYDANGVVVGVSSLGCSTGQRVLWGTATNDYTYDEIPCWSPPSGSNPNIPCEGLGNDFTCVF